MLCVLWVFKEIKVLPPSTSVSLLTVSQQFILWWRCNRDTSFIHSVMERIRSCFNSYSRIKHLGIFGMLFYVLLNGRNVILCSEMFWCWVFLLFSLQVISHRKVMRRRGLNWLVLIFLSLQVKIFMLSLACPPCLDSSASCFLTGYIACRHFR